MVRDLGGRVYRLTVFQHDHHMTLDVFLRILRAMPDLGTKDHGCFGYREVIR
jgi:hypothetical protein